MAVIIAEKKKVKDLKEVWEKAISKTIGGGEGIKDYPLIPVSLQPQILNALDILHALAYDMQLDIAELQEEIGSNIKKLHIDSESYFEWETAGGEIFNFRYKIKDVSEVFYLDEISEDFFFQAILKIISNFVIKEV